MHCSKTRIRRLMQQEGLCPRQKRRVRPHTTRCDPHRPCAPHMVAALPPADAPRQRFHSDITYIPTKEGFLYLAATVDAFSRHCAGWCARDNMETQLVKDAACMAFASASASASASERVHHSDRGSQYASESFRLLLAKEQIAQSMSRKGNCYDNALGESFWATVKTECFDNFRAGIPQTKAEAMTALFGYIELFYHRERLHSALDYRSPVQFEQDWTDQNFTDNVSTLSRKDQANSKTDKSRKVNNRHNTGKCRPGMNKRRISSKMGRTIGNRWMARRNNKMITRRVLKCPLKGRLRRSNRR